MAGKLPDFIIIGAMKCGTSTLHEQLNARSGLFLSDPKEPNFFSDDETGAGLADYMRLFEGATSSQKCGESSTHYTKLPTYPRTVENMRRHVGHARLIYVMRDPVERIVSQYIHEWTQLEVEGRIDDAVRRHERYVAYSSYARQLRPFLEHWGPENVLPMSMERMIAEPKEELARVCRFIGDPSTEEIEWHDDLGEQNVSRDRMRKSAVRTRLLEVQVIQNLKDRLPQKAKDFIKSYWQMRRRPVLSPAVREELRLRLDADLSELGRWLGSELSCENWKRAAPKLDWTWKNPPNRLAAAAPNAAPA
jgi:hypothetical protein